MQERVSRVELTRIDDPRLRSAYAACRAVNAQHGRTYFLSTLLLPPWKRPYVHALYAFARHADDIVDDLTSDASPEQRRKELDAWGGALLDDVARGRSSDPIRHAVVDTVARWDIPVAHFETFLTSMRMDLDVSEYATYSDLETYMHGSAAVIGRQMVPVLEPSDASAYDYAEDLGVAFQLANFVRDVGEDLRRGRLYLPLEDLAVHGVDREHLERGVVDGAVRRLLAFEIARTRELLRSGRAGVRLLHPTSRDCIKTAITLYGGICDAVEAAGYQVLDRRVAVGRLRRAGVATRGLLRASRARRNA
ncbi:MAG TPA: phytoene/squalene synthase family protein [Mycobacteriales bacterium]|nr:phytoene/squalene synthase family protein [Mycobacteriales bacterium]